MSAATFDTLRFAKKLKAVKLPEEQAEVVAEALRESFDERDRAMAAVEAKLQDLSAETKRNAEQMATKGDVHRLEAKLEARISSVENRIGLVEAKIEIASKDLLIKLGGTIGAAVAVMLAAMRWMPHA